MFELFNNTIIFGKPASVWPIFMAVIVLIITVIARSIFLRQTLIKIKKPERYLILRIDKVLINIFNKTLS